VRDCDQPRRGNGVGIANFQTVVNIVELVAVGVAAVAVMLWATVVRRRGGMPLLYDDQLPDTNRAVRANVWRALRVGHSDDPEIDVLARGVATRTLRGHLAFRWMIVLIALLALSPMFHLLDRHPPWLTVSARASGVIVLSAIAVVRYVGLRRSRRYVR
jgi:hypothetical protein